jgi:8-oxo-dGTP diphosphatase
MKRPGPMLTVDIIIEYPDGSIVLIRRGREPFLGRWALPGGRVEIGETVEQAAIREAKEETGLEVNLDRLIGVFSEPGRDPRGHSVTIVFHATPISGVPKASSDADEVLQCGDFLSLPLAFDHSKILLHAFPACPGSPTATSA